MEVCFGICLGIHLYLSAEFYPDRTLLVRVSLGETKLIGNELTKKVNGVVFTVVNYPDFLRLIEEYLKKESLFKEWSEQQSQEEQDD